MSTNGEFVDSTSGVHLFLTEKEALSQMVKLPSTMGAIGEVMNTKEVKKSIAMMMDSQSR